MRSAVIKNIFFKVRILLVYIFIKDSMFYEVVYSRESPSQITGKSSFYKVLSDIYIDICIFIFVWHLLLRKRYIVRH